MGREPDELEIDRIGDYWTEGTEWRQGTVVYRAERSRKHEMIQHNDRWEPVEAVMRALACVHGPENVRMVVWFDE